METTLYEFEGVYDPSYLNLDPKDPNAWKVYAEKVRSVMAKCLNAPTVDQNFHDCKPFTNIYR